MLRGAVVRIKYAAAYCLLPVEQLLVAPGRPPGLALPAPDGRPEAPPLRVSVSSVSGTDPLADGQWEVGGQAEAARLVALLQQRGQALPPTQVRLLPKRGAHVPAALRASQLL